MNNTTLSTFRPRRRRFAFVSGAILSATLAVAIVQASQEAKDGKETPSITLKTDIKEVNRGALEMASYSHIAKRVAPSVVKITVETKAKVVDVDEDSPLNDPFFRQFFGNRMPQMRQAPQSGLGSGVILSSDGYIVTNNHVIDKADLVSVTLDDGRELKAKVIGRDPQTDIAIIKVDAKDLPAVTFASSTQVEVGDRVLAIGNPFGIGETVTSGIVSAKSRRAGLGLAYEDFIQTDAAINPGNSGGALVDVDGRLIGINTAILSRSGGFQGVGLAVPSDMVQQVANSLVKHGKVVRGYLGVSVQNISPMLAESFKLPDRKGVIVTDVTVGSPAEKAGLKDGDIILTVNDQPVTDASRLSILVSTILPDSKVSLKVLRDGKEETLQATTGVLKKQGRFGATEEDDQGASADDEGVLNGVAVADLDQAARRQLNIPARIQGAVITKVDPGSAAARSGLQPGDVILEINRKPVTNAEDAVKLSEVSGNKKTLLKLWSRGGTVYTVVDESEGSGR